MVNRENMVDKIKIIAYYTFVEGLRNRLFALTVVGLVCLLGIAEFVGELAITETRGIQVVLIASMARWFIILTSALFVITSMVREFNDKGFELILSLPVSKISFYFGKFLGFLSISLVISIAVGILLFIYTESQYLMIWLASLICELTIIIAMSMLCLFTFSNITVSFVVVTSFYLLSRSIESIRLVSMSPILESYDFTQQFMNGLLASIAYVLPDLDKFTNSEWLIYGQTAGAIYFVILQTVIYLLLLISAGLFDLCRKNL